MEQLRSLISVSHQRIIANAIRQVRHCRSQPFSKSAEMLSTHMHSALHTSLLPSPPITSLHCNRSGHMPAQQKPSGGAGLRQEALRDRQPEGADSALLQAGAPADVSSRSPTAIAFSVTLALKPTSHTHIHAYTRTSTLLWTNTDQRFLLCVKSFFLDRRCSAAFPSLRL